ncbi:MAG TPA: MGMT family protein [Thermotogota bacterium]|jgi:O-6-methylguanine DNA methyltransferase|nr:MGMT family protein [Thermotogota bacterium]NLZ13157.1 MGMT family protein [Thermotogaceae bacterium]MDD8042108.1 MGMT family protein [Thermotogota bacterium]HNR63502.1 MGMT family protein [Thermotogota bacterium]HNT94997.1 MGMT family protein [Thermotogota bacterium]
MIVFRPLPPEIKAEHCRVDLLPFFGGAIRIEWLENPSGKLSEGLVQARFIARTTKGAIVKSAGASQFLSFLEGRTQAMDMVLYHSEDFSPFFLEVYQVLVDEVPYGETISYSALAAKMRRRCSPRAIGLAMSKNLWPLAVPCHRVLTKTGQLGGYQGGIENKRALLDMERLRMA